MLLRLALSAASALFAGLFLVQWHLHSQSADELTLLLGQHGLIERQPETVSTLRKETDPQHSRVLAARALLSDALKTEDYLKLESMDDRLALLDSRVDGLEVAAAMATEALESRPTSWQAALIVGASTYLKRSINQERALITEFRDWEAPLELSLRLAPSQAEPNRFLTMAYLEVWQVLSEEKKDETRAMLTTSFKDRATFERMIGPWLQVNRSLDDAFELLPEEPFVWERVRQLTRDYRDWDAFITAHTHYLEALHQTVQVSLQEGVQMVTHGNSRQGRDRLQRVCALSPRRRAVPLLVESLRNLPAGPVQKACSLAFRDWLQWELKQCLNGHCSLPKDTVQRMATLADSDLDLVTRTRVKLLFDDLAQAERLERRALEEGTPIFSEEWGPYHLEKSAAFLRRGELAKARAALESVHRQWVGGPNYSIERQKIAEVANDGLEIAQTDEGLRAQMKTSWEALEWRLEQNRTFTLPMLLETGSSGVVIELESTPEQGSVLAASLNGQDVALFKVDSRTRRLRVRHPLKKGLHHLELQLLAGSTTSPGRVRLSR